MSGQTISVEIPRRALQIASDKLPDGVTVLMVPPDALPPEFIRLPDGKERCSVTGMSRTWLLERIRESQGTAHPIKAFHLRQKGALRGVILINRQSLVDHIEATPPPSWGKPVENHADATA